MAVTGTTGATATDLASLTESQRIMTAKVKEFEVESVALKKVIKQI